MIDRLEGSRPKAALIILSVAPVGIIHQSAEPSSNQTNGAQLCRSGLINDADVEVEMRNGGGAGEFIVNGSIHKYAFARVYGSTDMCTPFTSYVLFGLVCSGALPLLTQSPV